MCIVHCAVCPLLLPFVILLVTGYPLLALLPVLPLSCPAVTLCTFVPPPSPLSLYPPTFQIGLSRSTIASSFGRVVGEAKELADYKKEDMALSLLRMVSYNIGQVRGNALGE